MNLQSPSGNDATQTSNRSKDVVPGSGLCSRCIEGCRGNCEVFKSSFRGREVIYPGPFGEVTAGGDKDYPIDYSHLNILGYALGAEGPARRRRAATPTTRSSRWSTPRPSSADENKVKMRVPIFTGALGSTEIARKNWEHFAVGAAISRHLLVCGENVCGIDPALERDAKGKVTRVARHGAPRRDLPALPRGLRRHPRPDERRGHAPRRRRVRRREARRRDDRAQVGPGRQVHRRRDQGRLASSARSSCRSRGYLVTPDPSDPAVQAAFQDRRDQPVRAPQPPGLRGRGGLLRRGRAPARPRRQARHAQDRRLPDARARDGHQVGVATPRSTCSPSTARPAARA